MKKQIVESCEMCSRETRSPTTIKVEGALLNVCGNCVSFGNVIEDKKPQLNYVKSQKTQNKNELIDDIMEFENNMTNLYENPLGVSALTGTSFNIDRNYTIFVQ